MSTLLLLLTDLPAAPGGGGARLRLPALEHLLRATAIPVPDWRGWLARELGAPTLALAAPGGIAAGGWLERPQPHLSYWLATPVHCFAGLDSVHLHPAGLLTLPMAVQRQLCEDFTRVFGEAPYRLYATGRRELLLSAPAAGSVRTEEPALFLGREPAAGLPQGGGAKPLRRLGSELEMWLFEHALNRERSAAGELPVTGLWLWGGGAPATPAPTQPSAQVYAHDTYAEALTRLVGGTPQAPPPEFAHLHAPAPARSMVLLSIEAAGFERLEQQWLAPALAALRQGQLRELSLLAAGRMQRLRRFGLWRFGSPPPWWESL